MPKPHIIAVSGVSNSGKTTTLKNLIETLEKDSAQYEKIFIDKKQVDWSASFKELSSNKIIYIYTAGDSYQIVENNIKKSPNANVIITACRTKGEVKKIIRNKSGKLDIINKPQILIWDRLRGTTKQDYTEQMVKSIKDKL